MKKGKTYLVNFSIASGKAIVLQKVLSLFSIPYFVSYNQFDKSHLVATDHLGMLTGSLMDGAGWLPRNKFCND